jgi:hypothetical protein
VLDPSSDCGMMCVFCIVEVLPAVVLFVVLFCGGVALPPPSEILTSSIRDGRNSEAVPGCDLIARSRSNLTLTPTYVYLSRLCEVQ